MSSGGEVSGENLTHGAGGEHPFAGGMSDLARVGRRNGDGRNGAQATDVDNLDGPAKAERDEQPAAEEREELRVRPVRREDVYKRHRSVSERAAERILRWLRSSRGEVAEREAERSVRSPAPNSQTNVVTFAGSRGGTGKSTMAVSSGAAISDISRLNIVAFDPDLDYGPLPDHAHDASRSEKTVVDLLRDFGGDQAVALPRLRPYLSRMPSGLLVLAAPRRREEMRALTAGDLDRALALLGNFDLCLLDCPGGIERDLSPWAIERCDRLVIVTTPEYIGAENVARAMAGLPLQKAILVINKVRQENGDGVGALLERRLFAQLVSRRVVVRYDEQLHQMLDEARLDIARLERGTRNELKQLAAAIVEQLQ